MSGPRFDEIPQLTSHHGAYAIAVPFASIERQLEEFANDTGVDLDPDFQRGHVWSEAQQIAFVEYALQGGLFYSGQHILFNCPTWNETGAGDEPVQLVDGKQRLTAARRFMNDEIPAFGHLRSAYVDKPHRMDLRFTFWVNNLPTRADVLRWYLALNAGGTPHSPDEIARVKDLLAKTEENP